MIYQTEDRKLSIKEWNPEEQPRERLLKYGAEKLSDSELLAILISTGNKKYSAIELARYILNEFDGLNGLTLNAKKLKGINGIGDAKYCIISSAIELSKRIRAKSFNFDAPIKSPEQIADIYIPRFIGEEKEHFYVLILNTANVIKKECLISVGTLNASLVHPREVFKEAILNSANSIILLHNHPSLNPKPSEADIKITKQIVQAANYFDIKVLDHIIIAGESFTSLKNEGLMY